MNNIQKVDNLFNEAKELFNSKNFAGAKEKLNLILSIDPQFVLAHSHLGVIEFKNKEYQDAIHHCDTAIDLDPLCAHAYYIKALICEETGEVPIAVKNINKAIKINSRDASFYLLRCKINMSQSEFNSAQNDMLKAIESNNLYGGFSDYDIILQSLRTMETLIENEQFDQSKKVISMLIEWYPQYNDTYNFNKLYSLSSEENTSEILYKIKDLFNKKMKVPTPDTSNRDKLLLKEILININKR